MTPEELLEINPNLVKVAGFIKEHPEYPVRFWNNGTVDITLSKDGHLGKFLEQFRCPSCGEPTSGPDIKPGTGDIKGTFRTCGTCSIKFFVHNAVKFGGTPT